MTRSAILSHLKRIGATNVVSAVAEGYAVLRKRENGGRLLNGDIIAAGIVWYEFFAEYNMGYDYHAAIETQRWLRAKLGLDNVEMFQEAERVGGMK